MSTRWAGVRLGGALELVLPEYDVILIDRQPSLGQLRSTRWRAHGDRAAGMRVLAMRGVALLMETIDKVSGG